ncbi:MAG TPA: sensor histidine kinase [Phototrophicaceae bacterium]|nr:sensor histidine kinase [Phototrophicaceae bacterium]
MITNKGLDSLVVLDGLSQGVLIFDSANRLVQENAAARAILGADLKLIRAEGWVAAELLFNSRLTDPTKMVDTARTLAAQLNQPMRFHIYRSGERVPCWISALRIADQAYTMVTIETPDWSAIADLMEKYLEEVREVVNATEGHADLIMQSVSHAKPNETVEMLARRITGFTRVIDIHMDRLRTLTDLVERLERVRTGKVREQIKLTTRRTVISDFMEDFLEVIDEIKLVDPESDTGEHRKRIIPVIPQKLAAAVAPDQLTQILRDVLRNAIMYSMRGSPIKIAAYTNRDNTVQIDVIDEGYGIRASESERVFQPFMRSRQPQVMGEFGYGLSLYLCKNEIEAMNGRIWFDSEEGVGTTFSLKLPAWRDGASSSG